MTKEEAAQKFVDMLTEQQCIHNKIMDKLRKEQE